MLQKIKSVIPERIKGPIRAQLEPASAPDLEVWKGQKKVVITLAGFYQNLGDMALTYAQKKFIEATLPDYKVLLFPSTDTYRRMKSLKKIVERDDIVTTIAGGNMDDIYPSLENARRYVVKSFPNIPIISFPQTIAFTETPSGKRALARSAKTYLSHKNLVIFGREPRTLELMEQSFPGADIRYCPDIVLSLQPTVSNVKRSGVMLTVRNDLEVLLSADERSSIRDVIDSKTDDVIVRDTVDVELRDCQPDRFEATLEEFWSLLSSRKVVVTDRLHCMIFCVITKTPVVVLPNSNHKIKGTYEAWLKDHNYVRFLDSYDPEMLSKSLDALWELEEDQITGPDLEPHYQPLRDALLQAAGRI